MLENQWCKHTLRINCVYSFSTATMCNRMRPNVTLCPSSIACLVSMYIIRTWIQNDIRRLVTDATWYPRYLQKQEMYFLASVARQFDISAVTGSFWWLTNGESRQIHSYTFCNELWACGIIMSFCLASIITLSQLTNSLATLIYILFTCNCRSVSDSTSCSSVRNEPQGTSPA